MKRAVSILLAAALAAGGVSASFSAAATPRASSAIVAGGNYVHQVDDDDEWRWRKRGGKRGGKHWQFRDFDDDFRRGSFRHYRYDDDYPRYYRRHSRFDDDIAVPLGLFGLATGLIIGSQLHSQPVYPAPVYRGSSWHEACDRKYNSFDWGSGTFLGYDGYRHRCVLP
jgi:Ni/Co efflux regulator RcnB